MEERTGIVYCCTNRINGKMYIGKTDKYRQRKQAHLSDARHGSRNHFHNAIRKYGENAFSWKVLEKNIPIDIINDVEMVYIELFGTFLPNNGYNMTHGGEGVYGYTITDERRKEMSETRTGTQNGFYGKHHTDEYKRMKTKLYSGENASWYGKKHTDETKEKMSLAATGNKKSAKVRKNMRRARKDNKGMPEHVLAKKRKEVFQKTLEGVFITRWSSISRASKMTGAPIECIIRVCKGRNKTSGGFKWEYVNDVDKVAVYDGKAKGVLQYEQTGKYVATYFSLHEAERETGVAISQICEVCKGKYKTAGGFKWEYADKERKEK